MEDEVNGRRPQVGLAQVARRAKMDRAMVERVFDVVLAFLEEDTSVKVPQFGTFIPEHRKGREVRSPMVKDGPVLIPAGRVVKFRMATGLRRLWYAPDLSLIHI